MPQLCCTSDFNGDGLLSTVDYRFYAIWSRYVDHNKPIDQQMIDVGTWYSALYPGDTEESMVALPGLDCADYNGDLSLSIVDYRVYAIWSRYIDQGQPIEDQLVSLDTWYSMLYPADNSILAVRIPAILDPINCDVEHGWFVTPWHDTVTIGSKVYGWLE